MLQYAVEHDSLIHGNNYVKLDEEHKTIYKKMTHDQFLAISFLLVGNRTKYSHLVAELPNSYTMGVIQYPKDIEEAYDMMISYSPVIGHTNPGNKKIRELYTTGISFNQAQQKNNIMDKDQSKM